MHSGKNNFNTNNEQLGLSQIIDNALTDQLRASKQTTCADLVTGKREYVFLPMAALYSDVALILAEPARTNLTNKMILDCARGIVPEINYAIVGQGSVDGENQQHEAASMAVYTGSPTIMGAMSDANHRLGVYLATCQQGIDKAMDVKAEIENPVLMTCKKFMRFIKGN